MDRLLLRNPASYKSGFWATFLHSGQASIVTSTEPTRKMEILSSDHSKDTLNVRLRFAEDDTKPLIEINHMLWSKNQPMLLWRFSLKNVSKQVLEDVKTYMFMDFDISGPRSYKDDMGKFDPEENRMTFWDENSLFVSIVSRPDPDGWEISAPFGLNVTEDQRDLKNNLESGPADIASGLQWNVGNLQPDESVTIEVVIASAVSLDEVSALIPEGWKHFGTKMR